MCGSTRCLIEFFFLLACFQMQTHSPSLSPLPFAQKKAHPLATLHFLSLASSRLSICHSSGHFRPPNLLQLFQTTPSLIPDSAPPLLKNPIALSFPVRSRLNAARLYHCQPFAKPPGRGSGGGSGRSRTLSGVGSGAGLSWIKAFT